MTRGRRRSGGNSHQRAIDRVLHPVDVKKKPVPPTDTVETRLSANQATIFKEPGARTLFGLKKGSRLNSTLPKTDVHQKFAVSNGTIRPYRLPFGRISFLSRSLVTPCRPAHLTSKNAAVPAAKPVPAVATVQPSPCGSSSENIIARMAR